MYDLTSNPNPALDPAAEAVLLGVLPLTEDDGSKLAVELPPVCIDETLIFAAVPSVCLILKRLIFRIDSAIAVLAGIAEAF